MPVYAGYESDTSSPIDWAKLSGELGEKIDTAIGTRGRERQAFDDIRQQNEDLINSYELGQNQTANDLILNGANSGRDQIWEWNKMANAGEMTRSEYTKRQSALSSNWSNFANAAKTFDERTMKTLARQQGVDGNPPEGSGLELSINKRHSEIADIRNKNIYINPETGSIYLAQYNKDGEMTSQVDVRQMNNPGNMLDNRVNLTKSVAAGTKDWAEWMISDVATDGSSSTVTDVRKNTAFNAAKLSLVDAILTNSRSTASVLTDNSDGNYEFYYPSEDGNRDELDAKLQTALEKARRVAEASGVELDEKMFLEDTEKLMIAVQRDETGVYQPMITDEQQDAAREYVSNAIEIQLGYEEKITAKDAPRYYGGGGGNNGNDDGGGYATYEAMIDAWDRGDEGAMNLLNPNYSFKLDRKTWTWKVNERTIKTTDGIDRVVYTEVGSADTPRELSGLVFKYGVKEGDSAQDKYGREVSAYKNKFGTVSSHWKQNRKKPELTAEELLEKYGG